MAGPQFGVELLFGDYLFLKSQLDLAAVGNVPVLVTDPTGVRDLRGVGNNLLHPSYATADTLFKRYTFNSLTAGLRNNGSTYGGSIGTTTFNWGPSALGLSYMGYTTQGTPNALGVAFNKDLNYSKHYGAFVQNALAPSGWSYNRTGVVDYSVRGTTIIDANPRLISNLISNQADQTLLAVQDDPLTTPGGRVNPLTGVTNPLPFSMYLASWGQYLDHGLDLVLKGVDGKILVPILPGDEMYTAPGQFLTVSRTNTANVTIQAGSTDALMTSWGLAQGGVPSFGPVTSSNALPATANTGTLMLNGRLITFANATSTDVVTAINAQTAWTGVTASLDPTSRLVLTPAKAESFNTISPHLDLSQDYGSDASQRIYLLEYTSIGGVPTATGNLLSQSNGGVVNPGASGFGSVPRWADIKANALKLGLTLHDYNVGDTPQIKTNADGSVWLDPVTRTARFLAVNNVTGALVEITDTALDQLAAQGLTLLTVGHAFLNDRGPFSLASDGANVPGFPYALTPAGDNPVGYDAGMVSFFTTNGYGTFQPLNAHVIAGDGRTNENIGLTAIQDLWHAEHNRNVELIKTTFGMVPNLTAGAFNGTYTAFATPGSTTTFPNAPAGDIWTGEQLFQAAKIITESEYQHFNFAEFIRKISPNVAAFQGYNINLDANISAEFASAVYRFGHSMLAETLNLKNAAGTVTQKALLDAFLSPTSYGNTTAADLARGTTQQVGNEIDEWVTDTLRNHLVGQKLDLATANIARGRDAGVPSLNDVRSSLYQQTGLLDLSPYTSWTSLGANLLHGQATLKEFIMAYAHDDILTRYYNQIPGLAGATKPLTNNLGAWVAFQLDPTKADTPGKVGSNGFYSGPGGVAPVLGAYSQALSAAADLAMADATWMGPNGNQDFWNVDLWTGGLAEVKAAGSMLGSTMDAVFSIQMNNLQNGDRFYYITRLGAAQNILASFDQMTLADVVMRNTGATHLYSDVFSVPDAVIEISNYQDVLGNPLAGTTYTSVTAMQAAGAKAGWVGTTGNWTFTGNPGAYTDARGVANPNGSGNASELIGGTNFGEKIDGLAGNETIWGDGGNDSIQGGDGNDFLHGGDGNDQINDLAGDDLIWGDAGDDLIRAGAGIDIVVAGDGNDTAYGGGGADADIHGNDGNDLLYGGDGATLNGVLDPSDGGDVISGDRGNDTIYGGGGNDVIDGGEGDDMIYGGIDNNVLKGFNGNDQFLVDATHFGYQNAFSGGLGIDTVDYRASNGQMLTTGVAGINIDLGNVGAGIVIPVGRNVKDVFLSIEEVWGSRFADTITAGNAIQVDALGNPILGPNGVPLPINANLHGWDGNDNLTGAAGNDTLDGGLGIDRMTGLAGNDLYLVDALGDVVTEAVAQGTDTVNASIDYTLGAEVENLTLLLPALVGTGNALNNVILGNTANNNLSGLAGNDTLDGGGGNDSMDGGLGDDTYVVDSTLDVVVEAAAAGIDTVNSTVSHTLGANVENLTLLGTAALTGTGNTLANLILGNAGNNILNGALGNDSMRGGAGSDQFVFNSALGATNVDSISDFSTGDTLVLDRTIFSALSGGTTLTTGEFLSGTGVVAANNGLQRIIYDTSSGAVRYDSDGSGAAAAVLFANLNAGAPLTAAAITLTGPLPPPPNVINGTALADNLTGTAAIDTLNGLGGNDTLSGLAGNDQLNGGDGNDSINGGLGVDTLTGGIGSDTFVFDATGTVNSDVISDFSVAQVDRIGLSAAVFVGINNAGKPLDPKQFLSGAGVVAATTQDHRILFNTTTGDLFWDRDGNRTGYSPIPFATLNPVAALTNTQFVMV